MTSVPPLRWRKSTYSGTTGDCFEISQRRDETTAVRNSNHTTAGSLVFASSRMGAFIAACRTGEFDDLAGRGSATRGLADRLAPRRRDRRR